MTWEEQLNLSRSALSDPRLSRELTGEERAILSAKPGKLRTMDVHAGLYAADSIDILAEALGGTRPPPLGRAAYCVTTAKFHPAAILGSSIAPWLAAPRLLPTKELRHLLSRTEAYTWRLRVHILTLTTAFREAVPVKRDWDETMRRQMELGREIDAFVAQVVAERAAVCRRRGLFEPINSDFPVGKQTFRRAMERNLLFAEHDEAAANARCRAACWLRDSAPSWHTTRAVTDIGFVIPSRLRGKGAARFVRTHFDPDVQLSSFRGLR